MTAHPCLHAIPGGKTTHATVLDRERCHGIGEPRRLFEPRAVDQCQCKTGAERVARARRIDHAIGHEAGDRRLPPVA